MDADNIDKLARYVGEAWLIKEFFGPTIQHYGDQFKDWNVRKVENVARAIRSAIRKTETGRPGVVSPRVLEGILEEASKCEDELMAEYFGGVLASSRSETGRDDRGTYFVALLSRMSSYQVRSHYVFYRALKDLMHGRAFRFGVPEDLRQMNLYFPHETYFEALDLSPSERTTYVNILLHSFYGLMREGLISNSRYGIGPAEDLKCNSQDMI